MGDVVGVIPDAGVFVTAKRSDRGKIDTIAVVKEAGGTIFQYTPSGPFGKPFVRYGESHTVEGAPVIHWFDFDGDGVFDQRVIVGDVPRLNASTGGQIWLEGKWTSARGGDGKHGTVYVEEVKYQFDAATGTWQRAPE